VDESAQLEAARRVEDAFEETRFREQNGQPGEDEGQNDSIMMIVLNSVAQREAEVGLPGSFASWLRIPCLAAGRTALRA